MVRRVSSMEIKGHLYRLGDEIIVVNTHDHVANIGSIGSIVEIDGDDPIVPFRVMFTEFYQLHPSVGNNVALWVSLHSVKPWIVTIPEEEIEL